MLLIDYRDGRPIYEQVIDGIEQMVVHGVLAPDSQLPSVRQMAAELSINPNTIQRAYSELESRGVIYSVKGKGNFVSPDGSTLRLRRLDEIGRQIGELIRTARELGADDTQIAAWLAGEGETKCSGQSTPPSGLAIFWRSIMWTPRSRTARSSV